MFNRNYSVLTYKLEFDEEGHLIRLAFGDPPSPEGEGKSYGCRVLQKPSPRGEGAPKGRMRCLFCPRRREAVVWPTRRIPKTRQLLPPGAAWQIPIWRGGLNSYCGKLEFDELCSSNSWNREQGKLACKPSQGHHIWCPRGAWLSVHEALTDILQSV